jgi:hypothetical protein
MTNFLARFTKEDKMKERCILIIVTGYHRQPTDESSSRHANKSYRKNISLISETPQMPKLRLDAHDIRGPQNRAHPLRPQ